MDKSSLGMRFLHEKMFLYNPMKFRDLELIQIGEICLEPKFEIANHKQFCNEISYIVSGSGFFIFNGEKTPISSGDVILSPADGEHHIIASENEKLFYCYMGFKFIPNSSIPENIIDFFNQTNELHINCAEEIYDYYRKCIMEIFRNNSSQPLLLESYLLQIVLLTHRIATEQDSKNEQIKNSQSSKQLTYLVQKYIYEHIYESVAIKEIAMELGYSHCYISHIFSKQMDISLKKYITHCKIEKAKQMMNDKKLSITEISRKLGFINLQSFSRTFYRETGYYPKEFNRKNLSG